MITLDDFTFSDLTSAQSGALRPGRSTPSDIPHFGGLSVTCANCGARPVISDDRCRACYQFRYRNGYDRPDKLIVRAAQRHEIRSALPSSSITLANEIECAMTRAEYDAEPQTVANCSESHCLRLPYDELGRCKQHHDLAWHRSQRTAA